MQPTRLALILILLAFAAPLPAQEREGELAKVKEQELAEVRERISDLKKSMDRAAEERDRLTGELQELEIAIAEQRARIRKLERDQQYTANKKRELDNELAEREAHLDTESEALAAQVRAAYMSPITSRRSSSRSAGSMNSVRRSPPRRHAWLSLPRLAMTNSAGSTRRRKIAASCWGPCAAGSTTKARRSSALLPRNGISRA
jgi:septal ring factor EnvC (AmiA/AmiB activator)